jgi:hypothetical protein
MLFLYLPLGAAFQWKEHDESQNRGRLKSTRNCGLEKHHRSVG